MERQIDVLYFPKLFPCWMTTKAHAWELVKAHES